MKMPKLRFKADDGSDFPEWQSISLDIACEINPETETLADQFYYMDLKSVDSGQWTEPKLLQKSSAPSRARRVAVEDDVFFQSVRPYNKGHYHFTQYRDRQVVASTGFIQTRMRNGSNSFLYHLFFTDSFNAKISFICAGSNYPAINSTEFGKIVVSFPSASEQHKIAKCLDAIDLIIAKQQAEIEAWEQYKKGVAQKLFDQEVRFKADDGSDYPDWQNVTLNELGRLTSGNGFSLKYQGHTDKPIDFYKVSDMNLPQNYKEMVTAQNTVDDDILKLMKIKPITSPSIIFAKVGMAIHAERKRTVNKPFCMDNNMMAFTPKSDVNFNFCYWLTQTLAFAKHAQPGSPPSLTATIIGNLPVSIPSSIEEQLKIAECLDAIDDVIALSKAELEKWRELKKGLLQQLFV